MPEEVDLQLGSLRLGHPQPEADGHPGNGDHRVDGGQHPDGAVLVVVVEVGAEDRVDQLDSERWSLAGQDAGDGGEEGQDHSGTVMIGFDSWGSGMGPSAWCESGMSVAASMGALSQRSLPKKASPVRRLM